MIFPQAGRTMVLILSLATVPAFATPSHHAVASSRTHASLKHTSLKHKAGKFSKKVVAKLRGQREIDPQRATQIQEALIRENYMSGAPSGQWDSNTETAMLKFQADHGWQTKLTPDSRALIKLGLGPNPSDTATPLVTGAGRTTAIAGASESDTLASAHAIRE
jgi:peptidoglycan hydrolase-like protein with peptidoglycan-binding domain